MSFAETTNPQLKNRFSVNCQIIFVYLFPQKFFCFKFKVDKMAVSSRVMFSLRKTERASRSLKMEL